MSRRLSFFLAFLTCGFATPIEAQSIDCTLVAPQGGHNLTTEAQGDLEIEIGGLVGRLANLNSDVAGIYRQFKTDTLQHYDDNARLYVVERLIFIKCDFISKSSLSDERKNEEIDKLISLFEHREDISGLPDNRHLVGYYSFNGDYTDSSGQGNDGNGLGNIGFIDGILGQALYFDGSYSCVSIPSSSSLNPQKELTVSFWTRVESLPTSSSGWASLFHKGGPSSSTERERNYSNREYSLFLGAGKGGLLHLAVSGDGEAGQSVVNVYPGSEHLQGWLHYAAVIDRIKHTIRVYVNGEMEGSVEDRYGLFNNNSYDLTIGCAEEAPSDYFNGAIDELMIYRRALTRDEIRSLWKEGA